MVDWKWRKTFEFAILLYPIILILIATLVMWIWELCQ